MPLFFSGGLSSGTVTRRLQLQVEAKQIGSTVGTHIAQGLDQAYGKTSTHLAGVRDNLVKINDRVGDFSETIQAFPIAMQGFQSAIGMFSNAAQASDELKNHFNLTKKTYGEFTGYVEAKSADLLQSQESMYQGIGQAMILHMGPKATEQIVTSAAKLATVLHSDLNTTVTTGTAYIKAFHLSAKQIPGLFNDMEIAGIQSGHGMDLFAGALGKMMMIAGQAGIKVQDIIGNIAALAKMAPGSIGLVTRSLTTFVGNLSNASSSSSRTATITEATLLSGGDTGLLRQLAQDPTLQKAAGTQASALGTSNIAALQQVFKNLVSQNSTFQKAFAGEVKKMATPSDLGLADFSKYGLRGVIENMLRITKHDLGARTSIFGSGTNMAQLGALMRTSPVDLHKRNDLNNQFDNAMKEANNRLRHLTLKWDDMVIQLGSGLMPAISALTPVIGTFMDDVVKAGKFLGNIVPGGAKGIEIGLGSYALLNALIPGEGLGKRGYKAIGRYLGRRSGRLPGIAGTVENAAEQELGGGLSGGTINVRGAVVNVYGSGGIPGGGGPGVGGGAMTAEEKAAAEAEAAAKAAASRGPGSARAASAIAAETYKAEQAALAAEREANIWVRAGRIAGAPGRLLGSAVRWPFAKAGGFALEHIPGLARGVALAERIPILPAVLGGASKLAGPASIAAGGIITLGEMFGMIPRSSLAGQFGWDKLPVIGQAMNFDARKTFRNWNPRQGAIERFVGDRLGNVGSAGGIVAGGIGNTAGGFFSGLGGIAHQIFKDPTADAKKTGRSIGTGVVAGIKSTFFANKTITQDLATVDTRDYGLKIGQGFGTAIQHGLETTMNKAEEHRRITHIGEGWGKSLGSGLGSETKTLTDSLHKNSFQDWFAASLKAPFTRDARDAGQKTGTNLALGIKEGLGHDDLSKLLTVGSLGDSGWNLGHGLASSVNNAIGRSNVSSQGLKIGHDFVGAVNDAVNHTSVRHSGENLGRGLVTGLSSILRRRDVGDAADHMSKGIVDDVSKNLKQLPVKAYDESHKMSRAFTDSSVPITANKMGVSLLTNIDKSLNQLPAHANNRVHAMGDGINNASPVVVSAAKLMDKGVNDYLGYNGSGRNNKGADSKQSGFNFGDALAQGLNSQIPGLGSIAKTAFTSIWDWLGFASPNAKGYDPKASGANFVSELASGFESKVNMVIKAVADIWKPIQGLQGDLSGLGSWISKHNPLSFLGIGVGGSGVPSGGPVSATTKGRLANFIQKETGAPFEQCVALADQWLNNQGLPSVYGNANQWVSAPGYHAGLRGLGAGDINVWKPGAMTSGGQISGIGHVDIFLGYGKKNGVLGFWTLDANWPEGSGPHEMWHPIADLRDISGYVPDTGMGGAGGAATGLGGAGPRHSRTFLPAALMRRVQGTPEAGELGIFRQYSRETGIPISILLAQGLMESSGGRTTQAFMGYLDKSTYGSWSGQVGGASRTLEGYLHGHRAHGDLRTALLMYVMGPNFRWGQNDPNGQTWKGGLHYVNEIMAMAHYYSSAAGYKGGPGALGIPAGLIRAMEHLSNQLKPHVSGKETPIHVVAHCPPTTTHHHHPTHHHHTYPHGHPPPLLPWHHHRHGGSSGTHGTALVEHYGAAGMVSNKAINHLSKIEDHTRGMKDEMAGLRRDIQLLALSIRGLAAHHSGHGPNTRESGEALQAGAMLLPNF